MKKIKQDSLPFEQTIDVGKSIKKKVYAKDGSFVGIISGVRIDPNKLTIEGITIEKSLINKTYVGKSYIRRITEKGALLKIDI